MTMDKSQNHIKTSSQLRLPTDLSSTLGRGPSLSCYFKTARAVDECPASPSASSCSSEHSCCDNPACDFSTTASLQKSISCSLDACLNPEICDKVECCSDEACIHPNDDTQDQSSTYDAGDTIGHSHDVASDLIGNRVGGLDGSLSCQWLETDHQCSVTAPPAALSQHIFKDHIEQNTWLPCGWAQCDQTIESQQLLEHVSQAHQPDQYICLWEGCGYSFSSDEELAAHMSAMHCTKLDCHWGGCEYIDMDPIALKSHVYDEHLNMHPPTTFPPHLYSSLPSPPSAHRISQPSSSLSYGTSPSPPDFLPYLPNEPTPPLGTSHQHQCLWTSDKSTHAVCGALFPCENDLQSHLEQTHLKQLSARTNPLKTGIFVCRWQDCKASGSPHNGKDKLRKHTYTHTGCKDDYHLDRFCLVTDFSAGYYYQCHICSHKFALKGPYENHLRIHTGEKPFRCEKCKSTFPSKESLSMQPSFYSFQTLTPPFCSESHAHSYRREAPEMRDLWIPMR